MQNKTEFDYKTALEFDFINQISSPVDCPMLIFGTDDCVQPIEK